MIKLNELTRWRALAQGEVLTLPEGNSRRIRLEVNSPGRAPFYIVDSPTQMRFLAAPVGRDVIEFIADGEISITTGGDDVFVYTAELEPTFTVIEDAEVFTQIATRAARNPDMEHMMYLQQQNVERRMAQLQAEMEARLDQTYNAGRADAAREAATATEPVRSEADGDGSAPPGGDEADQPDTAGIAAGGQPVSRHAGAD